MSSRWRALLAIGALTAGASQWSGASAAPAATPPGQVIDGQARFEVLTPTLIRLEYAGDGKFQDLATVNAVNRTLPAPSYTTDVTSDGYREIHTANLLLRYRQGSGPFSSANLSVQLTVAGQAQTAHPSFVGGATCLFGALCEAENATPAGGASQASDHAGYTGSGFVAGIEQTGAGITAQVSAVPSAGTYPLTIRYANAQGGDNQTTTRTLSTVINGQAGPRFSLPPTANWDTWATATVNVPLNAGTDTVQIQQAGSDSGHVNIDSFALTAAGASYPSPTQAAGESTPYGSGPSDVLGGWYRGLDNPAALPVPLHPGILDKSGWYLLDDTQTALLNADGTITQRPGHAGQAYQDGYFFGYGHDYKQGLSDLHALTGPADLLPKSAFGVWYSRYYPYTTADYENTILPTFRSQKTPLDWLVVDTDFKAPSTWDGWNWNSSLFPDPTGFMNWTKQQQLAVTLNIHPSISDADPKFAATNATAGGLIADGTNQHVWDWSIPSQLKSYLDLHQPFEQQGVRAWWLDWCCDNSRASAPGITPDAFINAAYAADGNSKGLRGFAFSRMGASYQNYGGAYPAGPWAEHRSTLQFTGDTPATWDMLKFESGFTQAEGAIGLPYVSDDIGSYHGGHLADDMYVRWVQLGAFQPIERLHSDHGDRLPWNYDDAARIPAEQFLNLREALVPYTYTLAKQAQDTGVPMLRSLYLNYPESPEAYTYSNEYLYGDNVLVSPITSANDANGNGSVTTWFPPGTWTDYFTGKTYTGPSTATITDGLNAMPVFLRSGGIMTTRTNYVDNAQAPLNQLTVNAAAGADGTFNLYEDAGEGLQYQQGQSSTTTLGWNDSAHALTIGAAAGTYPGAITSRTYTLKLSNASAASAVTVDGQQLPASSYSYNTASRTLTVTTAALATATAHTVSLTPGATAAVGPITGNASKCVDVRASATANGTAVQLYACNATAAQQWTAIGDGSLRALGKCMDVAGGATANGTLVQLWDCNGTGAQQWVPQPDGTVRNPQSGRCLDDPNANPADGTQLQIWDCNTTAAQKWKLP
ncbi:glycoside hydrolase family 31 protein [Catenulispora yoronensis]|uniref:Glycoside hydrolase family 31 protein n=1 Tax=Catenulispora yoronensis TaxID=450799 RepID=A0ABN2UJ90_9ACTN